MSRRVGTHLSSSVEGSARGLHQADLGEEDLGDFVEAVGTVFGRPVASLMGAADTVAPCSAAINPH